MTISNFRVRYGLVVDNNSVIDSSGNWVGSIANIQGPRGPTGAQGAQGPIGAQGAQGAQGPTGPQGPTGAQGPLGPTGPNGNAGNTGPQGPQGATGPQGPTGAQGPTGPAGGQGPAGAQGPRGPQGAQGPQGPTGGQGPTGPAGGQGPTGVQGPRGPTGPTGPTGPQGPTGPTVTQVDALGVNTAAGPQGTVRATSNITAYYSDKRLKENIKNINNPIDKLSKINGIYFYHNNLAKSFGFFDNKRKTGVIAQEVQEVLPEAIAIAPFDSNKHGHSISGENYLTVRYERILPLLIETLKEQKNQIDYLKTFL